MNITVLISDSFISSDLILYLEKRFIGIKVLSSFDLKNSKKNINTSDILLLSEDIFLQCNLSKQKKERTILILNDSSNISKYYSLGFSDFLFRPLSNEIISSKIVNYINLLKNEYKFYRNEKFLKEVLNSSLNPIFLMKDKKIILSNSIFDEVINVNSLDELYTKYPNVESIFEKLIVSSNKKDWYKHCIFDDSCVCTIIKDKKECHYKIKTNYLIEDEIYVIYMNDMSKDSYYEEKITKILYTDNLTKLPNRSKLIIDLKDISNNIKSMAILDIKAFKEVNDFFGHKIADLVLIEVANIIHAYAINHKLKVYKHSNDTYCICNNTYEKNEFINLINSIILNINKRIFYFQEYEIDISICAGLSFSNENNKLITANIALEAAKEKNKDYLCFYKELDKVNELEKNMIWNKKLKYAIKNNNIIIFFQAIINNKTMQIDKFECLVRMIDDNQIISPYFFLDIAKKSNQYKDITKIVISLAFAEFEKKDYEFSVNISYEDIEDPEFLTFIKEKLLEYNVSNKVIFEILEDENIKNYDILISFIKEVKELGCKIAIDDFGTGYSNFEHLLKLDIDYLKIDASIVKNVAIDENSYKITKTIIEFAKSLNLKTVAEYVESEDIFNIIKELGADYSQGYYFYAPISKKDLAKINRNITI